MPAPKPKKLGDPNRFKVKSFRGATAEAMRAVNLARKTPEGQAERVVSFDPAAVRAAIEAQTCPICGMGPYKVLAVHTNKMHGIDKYDLRDMAGLTTQDSICAPEFSERARENAVRLQAHNSVPRARKRDRKPPRFTAAGLARNKQILADFLATVPAEQLAAQRSAAGKKRAQAFLSRQACDRGHLFDAANTRMDRHGDREYRRCRACEKEKSRDRLGFDPMNEVIAITGTVRRLQALAAMGHPLRELARRLEVSTWWIGTVMSRSENGHGVTRGTAEAVARLYDDLHSQPPTGSKSSRIAKSKALGKGWLPPGAWEGRDIDSAPPPGA